MILGRQIVRHLPGSRLFTHVPADNAAVVLGDSVDAINEWGATIVVELHWNALVYKNGKPVTTSKYWDASYGIVWHKSTRGAELCGALSAACSVVLDTRDMGVVVRSSGYPMLRDTRGVSVLLETHNGVCGRAHEAFLGGVARGVLAHGIAMAIKEWGQ